MKLNLLDQRKKVRAYFIAIVLLVVIAVLEVIGLMKPVRNIGEKISFPFLQFGVLVVHISAQPYLRLRHSFKAARKVQDLERKYAETSAKLVQLDALQKENQALKELLNSSDRDLSQVVITAPILSLASPAVGVGKNAQVLAGSMVLVNETLVGVVNKVFDNYSLVTLVHQDNSPAILAVTESGVQGLVRGDGRRVLLTEIPMDANLVIDEKVVAVGQEGIQKNVFIGRIVIIKSEPSALAKTAVLEQFVSFNEAVVVEVK